MVYYHFNIFNMASGEYTRDAKAWDDDSAMNEWVTANTTDDIKFCDFVFKGLFNIVDSED